MIKIISKTHPEWTGGEYKTFDRASHDLGVGVKSLLQAARTNEPTKNEGLLVCIPEGVRYNSRTLRGRI